MTGDRAGGREHPASRPGTPRRTAGPGVPGISPIAAARAPSTTFVTAVAPRDVRLNRSRVRAQPRMAAPPSLRPLVRVTVGRPGHGSSRVPDRSPAVAGRPAPFLPPVPRADGPRTNVPVAGVPPVHVVPRPGPAPMTGPEPPAPVTGPVPPAAPATGPVPPAPRVPDGALPPADAPSAQVLPVVTGRPAAPPVTAPHTPPFPGWEVGRPVRQQSAPAAPPPAPGGSGAADAALETVGRSDGAAPAARPGAVEVRRGPEAADVTGRLGARAASVGGVVHVPDRHGPATGPVVRALVAHELVHLDHDARRGPSAPRSPVEEAAEERLAASVEAWVRSGVLPEPVVVPARPRPDVGRAPWERRTPPDPGDGLVAPHAPDALSPVVRTPVVRTTSMLDAFAARPVEDAAVDPRTPGAGEPVHRAGAQPAAGAPVPAAPVPAAPVPAGPLPSPQVAHAPAAPSAVPPGPAPLPAATAADAPMTVDLTHHRTAQPLGTVHRAPEAPGAPDPSDGRGQALPPEQLDRVYRAVRERLRHDLLLERERTGGLVETRWR